MRRVLLAYSLHNPDIEYCQGFNRMAAIALLFLDEEDAFWCLVYIVEVLMPDSYYTKQMVGAQVDQVNSHLRETYFHLSIDSLETYQSKISRTHFILFSELDLFL